MNHIKDKKNENQNNIRFNDDLPDLFLHQQKPAGLSAG